MQSDDLYKKTMISSELKSVVYGPAYLDIVVRVDSPLIPDKSRVIDHGSNGKFEPSYSMSANQIIEITECFNQKLKIRGVHHNSICGHYKLNDASIQLINHEMNAVKIEEDIGGMGAGYANLLNAKLVSCLPEKNCSIKNRIASLIQRNSITHQPLFIPRAQTDWTLLVSSGRYGDKLPIGLRGCHDQFTSVSAIPHGPDEDLVVIASLKNEFMLELLKLHHGAIRMLSPALRNCYPTSNVITIADMAPHAEILAVNRFEWLAMDESARHAWKISDAIISVTDGPGGAHVSWQALGDQREYHYEPAFSRCIAPVDTNRAGEAFSGTLILELVRMGWSGRGHSPSREMIEKATKTASASAGLTIQIPGFGFPGREEILKTLQLGIIS